MNNGEQNKKGGASEFFKKPGMIAALIAIVVALAVVVIFLIIPKIKSNNNTTPVTDAGETTGASVTDDENNSTGTDTDLQITAVQEAEVKAGDTVTVTIKLTNVTDLASLALTASWDDELTLVDASYGADFKNGLRHTPDMDEEDGGWESVKSPFTFNWVALNASDAVYSDCTFITAQFKTAEGKPGTYNFTLKANPENIFDSEDENVAYVLKSAEIVVTAD